MEKIIKTNVGIDVSMDSYWATITFLTVDQEIKYVANCDFKNKESGFKDMIKWINKTIDKTTNLHFTMEATGVYYENIANYLFNQNFNVHVVLPNKAKKFIESLDIKSKTDKLDSKALGRLGVERKLRDWSPIDPIFTTLKALTRERERTICIRTQFKNNIHALKHSYNPNKRSIERILSMIEALDKYIEDIEADLSDEINKDFMIKDKITKLMTIPGVGQTTAITVVAETGGFHLIENVRQLCSYAGLDIKERESGKWKGQSKISKQGNSHIRAVLYFPSLTTIKYSPMHKDFYHRIIEEKKKSKIGITAVGRKLLILMYSIWKKDIEYDENYKNKPAA